MGSDGIAFDTPSVRLRRCLQKVGSGMERGTLSGRRRETSRGREWKIQEKAELPKVLTKIYHLAKGDFEIPSCIGIDPILAILADQSTVLTEDVPVGDMVDR
ncbi:hypothetical protein NDU88_010360 [Pleurodeles waltl]|uniref:Uncharacterized protein n=1 Tax=Pleurodeles waltl TaxID=8319 RepID=A0AAV7R021_PLEWA|nr:hypothetical protein NDU88_010360 [Pleurodeles waltl]